MSFVTGTLDKTQKLKFIIKNNLFPQMMSFGHVFKLAKLVFFASFVNYSDFRTRRNYPNRKE